jgi:hypothetical protein
LFSYAIQVADDGTLEGSYWSLFLVEGLEDPFADPEKDRSLGV